MLMPLEVVKTSLFSFYPSPDRLNFAIGGRGRHFNAGRLLLLEVEWAQEVASNGGLRCRLNIRP
jgi:hypothetical protein